LTKDYKGKVDIYKVNIEKESDMAAMFGVRSVPTLVMMSKNTKPTQIPGAPHKETMSEIINAFLEKDKNDS
jgi:thioredoxin-like negative regulator of GroEL